MWSANSVRGYPLVSMEGKAASHSSPYGVEVVIHLVIFLVLGLRRETKREGTKKPERKREQARERERETQTLRVQGPK